MLITHSSEMRSARGHCDESALGPQARAANRRVVDILKRMERLQVASSLDPAFRDLHRRLLAAVDEFQRLVLIDEDRTPTCSRGCQACCWHWVEDVNSFEAEILADYVRRVFPERVPSITQACRDDLDAIAELDAIVARKLRERESEIRRQNAQIDSVDVLLACFYRLRRPCPLLDDDGCCLAYPVRPLTCRIYVSFSEPHRCDPDYIDEGAPPTALLDLEERANAILDSLHFRFRRFGDDT
ncbi:MAG: hypothetical protein GF331_20425, partial [Chitinivibrionales bacterium]|nr:hypothetical protein [Chitinivibrionales bacterium]